jgi:rubrerythrin
MFSMDNSGCVYPNPGMNLLNDLTKAINGEYSAIICYERLANNAPSREERERILEIRNDEIRHLQIFANIYLTLTGRKPEPQIAEDCPKNYCKGVEAAFMDEQKTVDFYNEVGDQVTDPYIKEQFRRSALDEQNHAVWFTFFYFKNCC